MLHLNLYRTDSCDVGKFQAAVSADEELEEWAEYVIVEKDSAAVIMTDKSTSESVPWTHEDPNMMPSTPYATGAVEAATVSSDELDFVGGSGLGKSLPIECGWKIIPPEASSCLEQQTGSRIGDFNIKLTHEHKAIKAVHDPTEVLSISEEIDMDPPPPPAFPEELLDGLIQAVIVEALFDR